MRPSVPEQLEGLRRILAETIAPEITAPYPAEILGSVMMSLDALARAWYATPVYLAWDIAQTATLLAEARPLLDPALAAEIDDALLSRGPSGHPHLASPIKGEGYELKTLEDRQRHLHTLLCRAMPAIASDPALAPTKSRMTEFFRERADRFPFAMLARPAPKPAPKTES